MSQYTPDYFIKKFEAIPDDLWCTGDYQRGKAHCAFGHCGDESTEEGSWLNSLIREGISQRFGIVPDINDGRHPMFKQATPKARILAALHAVKAKLCPSSS